MTRLGSIKKDEQPKTSHDFCNMTFICDSRYLTKLIAT